MIAERIFADTIQSPGVNETFLVDVHMLKGDEAKSQKWYWIKDQKPDEVYIIQFFDNYAEKRGRPTGCPHGSPELLDSPDYEVEGPRESIEVRCLAVW